MKWKPVLNKSDKRATMALWQVRRSPGTWSGEKSVSQEKGEWENSASLLGGITSIGLVLISTISDIKPKWDEYLFLS